MGFESKGEGIEESGTWEPLKFTVSEVAEVDEVQTQAHHGKKSYMENVGPADLEAFKEEVADGFIYRKNGMAVASLVFSAPFEENTIHIEDLSVLPEYRSAGMTRKLLKLLKKYARDKGATHITWIPVSKVMEGLTKRVGAQRRVEKVTLPEGDIAELDYVSIPVDSIDEEKLFSMIKPDRNKGV